jgi:hypothetical protein
LVPTVNVVPAVGHGVVELAIRERDEHIGTKAMTKAIGACSPTVSTTKPRSPRASMTGAV